MKKLLPIKIMTAALFGLFVAGTAIAGHHEEGENKGKGMDMRPTEVTITVKDHTFHPAEITVAAGHRFRLIIINEDDTPIEFESDDTSPKLERIISGGNRGTVVVQGQEPGRYAFFDEFNEDEAQGVLIVVEDDSDED